MNARGFLVAAGLFASLGARAATLTESFTNRNDYVTGTAVWNQALGKIHPTLQVMNYEASFTPIAVDVGDGSDGVFDNTTYANFSVGGVVAGNIIQLDTDAHPVLQVTSFTLDQGWKIVPVGSQPLKIYSLSTVTILGEIHCEGGDGVAGSGATAGTGGTGHCGGKNGGNGGAVATVGVKGVDASVTVTGGGHGSGTGVGGGGGGSWSAASPPTNGSHGSAVDGQAGLYSSDPEFHTIAGGAGGGGGGGDVASAGGGGGAGGGVVIIHAVGDISIGQSPTSAFGFVYAGGGKGGNASGGGGPGGGGGGGSIQIFSAGNVNLYNTAAGGASQAPSGASGTNGNADTGATGGLGRSFLSTNTFFTGGTGTYSPIEEFPVNTGDTEFNPASQYVETIAFDTNTLFASIQSLTFTPTSTDFTFAVAGSSDNFVSDNTGFQTDPSLVANKRYLKMRLSIATSNVHSPDMIGTAAITYVLVGPAPLAAQDSFTFKSAGCGRVDGGSPGNSLWLLVTPLVLILLRFKSRKLAR